MAEIIYHCSEFPEKTLIVPETAVSESGRRKEVLEKALEIQRVCNSDCPEDCGIKYLIAELENTLGKTS